MGCITVGSPKVIKDAPRNLSCRLADLNGSLQHQLEGYFAEFKRLNSLAGIDSEDTLF